MKGRDGKSRRNSEEKVREEKMRKNKVGQRTQKQGGAQHTIFKKSCGVGSNALHETEARTLLRHRATIHHSILRQLRLDSSNSYFCYRHVIPFHLSNRYLCLGSCSVWFAAGGARTKRGWKEHGATWKLNDGVPRKKSRRELTKRAWAPRYEDHRSWMILKYERR